MSEPLPTITNEEKQQVYAELKRKLKLALKKEFYFEAVMLEYAIIEDRTASVLYHARVCKNPYDKKKTLAKKINSIQDQISQKDSIIAKKFDGSLTEQIRAWKEDRNTYVHRACINPYDGDHIKELAERGNKIVRDLDNSARRVKALANKLLELKTV